MILSDDGAFDETKVFKTGNQPMIIDHMGLNIGVSVGYDLLSPELYKYYAENDVDLLICIAAFNEKQMDRFDKIFLHRLVIDLRVHQERKLFRFQSCIPDHRDPQFRVLDQHELQ